MGWRWDADKPSRNTGFDNNHTAVMSNLGGWSPEKPVSEEVEKICIKLKSDIEKEAGIHFDVFIPKSCRFQVVAGINYLVKVHVGEDVFVHVMIFKALPGNGEELTVFGVQFPKTPSDPLIPF